MVRDLTDRTANGDALPDATPVEQCLPDRVSHAPQVSTVYSKYRRSCQAATKPLFVTAAPASATAGGARTHSTVEKAIRPQLGHAQTLPSAMQPAPFPTVPPAAAPSNGCGVGAQQQDAASHPSTHLVQSVRVDPNLYSAEGVSSAAVLAAAKKQVPPRSHMATRSEPKDWRSPGASQFQPAMCAPNGIATRMQHLHSRSADARRSVHHREKLKLGLGTGSLFPSSIPPKPLLNTPIPVPPRPAMHSVALRPTLGAAQLACAGLPSSATPPRTDAASPQQQRSTRSNPQPQAFAAGAATASAGQGRAQSRSAVQGNGVQQGSGPTAHVPLPKAPSLSHPDSSVPQMLAQVYADQGYSCSHIPVQVQGLVAGGAAHSALQHQLSIDVLVPSEDQAAASPSVLASAPSLPVHSSRAKLGAAALPEFVAANCAAPAAQSAAIHAQWCCSRKKLHAHTARPAAAGEPAQKPDLQVQGTSAPGRVSSILPQLMVEKRAAPAAPPRVQQRARAAPAAPDSPDSSTALPASVVTLQHLIDAGLIEAGVDVLQCTTGERSGQRVTLNADGTVQAAGAAACPLAELFTVWNGHGATQGADAEAWHCVAYDGHALVHYQRQYIARLGAASVRGRKRRVADACTGTPFIWTFFLNLAKQQTDEEMDAQARADAVGAASDCAPAAAEDDAQEEEEEAVVEDSPPRKRSRRQATTIVSYAKLATEGLPESRRSSGRSGRESPEGGGKEAAEHRIKVCSAQDVERPAEHELCRPLDITLLAGVERFEHLQPAPVTVAAPPVSLMPTSKPSAQSATHHEHAACPGAAAPAAWGGALQPLDKMSKLPPMPRKLKSFNAALPNAPKPAPSTTVTCAANVESAQRSRREPRAPARTGSAPGLTHTMMQLEAYARPAGEPGTDAQPFYVDVHPLVLAAMDIHAHLCQNEIIGVLGGRYDAQERRLIVVKSLFVQEGVLDVGKTDVEMDAADQSRAIEELRQQGLQCVGWYHSHPTFPVWPSAIDVYNQQIQQAARSHQATNSGATPYIAAIVGPYDQKNATAQCSMSWFYVENKRSAEFSLDAAPEVCLQHMVPKALSATLIADAQLPVAHITQCATELIERYAGYSSRTELRSFWRGDMTCLQKLVSSVFHSVRGFLDSDALKELGTSITGCALQHFYGVCMSSVQSTTTSKKSTRSGR